MGGAASSTGQKGASSASIKASSVPVWVEGLKLSNGGLYTGFAIKCGKKEPFLPDQVGTVAYGDNDESGRSTYSGLWSDGLKQGPGIMEYKDGSSYVGEWHADMMQGKGVLHVKGERGPVGTVYRGEFDKGERHGLGAETPAAFADADMLHFTKQVSSLGAWSESIEFSERENTAGSQGHPNTYEGSWEMGARSGKGVVGHLEEGRDPVLEEPTISRAEIVTYKKGEQMDSEYIDPDFWVHADLLKAVMELGGVVVAVERRTRDLCASIDVLRRRAEAHPERNDPKMTKKRLKEACADFLGNEVISGSIMESWRELHMNVEERASQARDDNAAQEAYQSYMKDMVEAARAKKKFEMEQANLELAIKEKERELREAQEAEDRADAARAHAKSLQDEAMFRGYAAKEARAEADAKRRDKDAATRRHTKAQKDNKAAQTNLAARQHKAEESLRLRLEAEELLAQHNIWHEAVSNEQRLYEKKSSMISIELCEISEQLDRAGGGAHGEMEWAKKLEEELKIVARKCKEVDEQCEDSGKTVEKDREAVQDAILALAESQQALSEAETKEESTKAELSEAEEAKIKAEKEYAAAKEEADVRQAESDIATQISEEAWEKARVAQEDAQRERREAEAAEMWQHAQSESVERAGQMYHREQSEAQAAKDRMSHAGAGLWYLPFTRPDTSDWTESEPVLYPTRNAEYVGEGQGGKRNGHGRLMLFSKALPYVRRGQGGRAVDPEEERKFDEAHRDAVIKAYYEGGWSNDAPDGEGVMMDPSGAVYEGFFVLGKRDGFGRVIEANGDKYEGEWVQDIREGYGKEELVMGEMYEGQWKEGERWGQGVCEHADSSVYSGEWVQGVKQGLGKIEGIGYFYEGNFWDGHVHGKGTCTYAYAGDQEEEKEEGGGAGELSDAGSTSDVGSDVGSDDERGRGGGGKDKDLDLPDSVYKGEWVEGKKHGKGNMHYSDGTLYVGEWEDDEPHGYGVMTFSNGDEYNGPFVQGLREGEKGTMDAMDLEGRRGVYLGHWRDDLMHGPGAVKWEDGTRFEGMFVSGNRTGKGKMWYENGDVYEGNFLAGQRNGQGVMTFADGSVYEGTYELDVKSGRGSLKSLNGDVFDGEFSLDMKEGKGRITFADGSVFLGDFSADERTGYGVMKFANGDVYEGGWWKGLKDGEGVEKGAGGDVYMGTFQNGLRHGTGKVSWVNGSWYGGLWARGKEDGYGTYMSPGGVSLYEGDWKEGKDKVGKGKFVYPDSSCYNGQWENQLRHGRGTFTKNNGYLYEGEWKNDRPDGTGREVSESGGSDYQGTFRLGKRHGQGCEIYPNGDQYVGSFNEGVRHGEGKEFLAGTRERYEGQFINGVRTGKGKSTMPDPAGGNHVVHYEGEWQNGVRHGVGVETVGDGPARNVQYSKGAEVPYIAKQPMQTHKEQKHAVVTQGESAQQKGRAIVSLFRSISELKDNKEERQQSISALRRLVNERHHDHKEWRRSVLAAGGIKHLVVMLSDDQDDEGQHQAALVLYEVSQTVDFTGLAEAVVREDGVPALIDLLTEDASVPRLHACGILNALCKHEGFAAVVAKTGGVGSLVFCLKNKGWDSQEGKVLAAKALDNLFEHQPAAVCSELGVNQAISGDVSTKMLAREASRSYLRKILAKAGSTLKEMPW